MRKELTVKQARTKAELTQMQVAVVLEIGHNTYHRWESANRIPRKLFRKMFWNLMKEHGVEQ